MEEYVLKKIKLLRVDKGFTQAEMSEKMGFSSPIGYLKIENGQTEVKLSHLEKLAKILQVTQEEILGFNQSESTKDEREVFFLKKELELDKREIELLKQENTQIKNALSSLIIKPIFDEVFPYLNDGIKKIKTFQIELDIENINKFLEDLNNAINQAIPAVLNSFSNKKRKEFDKIQGYNAYKLIDKSELPDPKYNDFNEYIRFENLNRREFELGAERKKENEVDPMKITQLNKTEKEKIIKAINYFKAIFEVLNLDLQLLNCDFSED